MHLESNYQDVKCSAVQSAQPPLEVCQCCLHFTSDIRMSMKKFFSGELPKIFNIRYLLLQMKAVRGWSCMGVALSQQCMWNSCPKHSVRHNPCLGILWPYRRFEFSTSFNALNFSTDSHNRIGYLLAFTPCWIQAFNPMNQKCCDCLVTWERRADIVRIVLLSKATFGGVSVAAKLHCPPFSLEADVVDRSQGKLLTQACEILVQDWSCATVVWSWYLFCRKCDTGMKGKRIMLSLWDFI